MSKPGQKWGLLAFALVLLDSMMAYYLRPLLGLKEVPVNGIIPIILLGLIMRWGIKSISPGGHLSIALVIGFFGFLSGIIVLPEFHIFRLGSLISAYSAFFIGYFISRSIEDVDRVARLFILVGGLYVAVCVLALHHASPILFPVIEREYNWWGMSIVRPEITTDQNFQVFYLLPIVLVLCLPYRFKRFFLSFGGLIGGLYTLNRLETRSGFLVLSFAASFCLLAPLFNKSLGRRKTFIFPLVITVLVIFTIDIILESATPIRRRFFDQDYDTMYARIGAFTYLLEHLFKPMWWFPHGNEHFRAITGGSLPHCTPTAIFLEAGILGLYMWIVVFLKPLLSLARMFLKSQLDQAAIVILTGGMSVFLVQLTVNLPLHEHIWLWTGAVVGTVARSKQLLVTEEEKQMNGSIAETRR